MGIAAYNRGSKIISDQISRDFPIRDAAFASMDRINAMPKVSICKDDIYSSSHKKRYPLLDKYAIQHDEARGVWWLMNPDDMHEGYSLAYPSLEDVIRYWDGLFLTGYNYETHIWTSEVIKS